jgi:hypothetical protein
LWEEKAGNYVRRTEYRMNRLWAWIKPPSGSADKECHEGGGGETIMRKEPVFCLGALTTWMSLRKVEDRTV